MRMRMRRICIEEEEQQGGGEDGGVDFEMNREAEEERGQKHATSEEKIQTQQNLKER